MEEFSLREILMVSISWIRHRLAKLCKTKEPYLAGPIIYANKIVQCSRVFLRLLVLHDQCCSCTTGPMELLSIYLPNSSFPTVTTTSIRDTESLVTWRMTLLCRSNPHQSGLGQSIRLRKSASRDLIPGQRSPAGVSGPISSLTWIVASNTESSQFSQFRVLMISNEPFL